MAHKTVLPVGRKASTSARATSEAHFKRPRVAIIGIGGVGGVIAAALRSSARCALTLVARGESLRALRCRGLDVETREGFRYKTALAEGETMSLEEAMAVPRCPDSAQEFVLLATKAHQLPSTLEVLRGGLVAAHTMIVPVVNGLPWWFWDGQSGRQEGLRLRCTDPSGLLHAGLNASRILGTVGYVSGHVVHTPRPYERHLSRWPSQRNELVIGSPQGGEDQAQAWALARLFDPEASVPVKAHAVPDVRRRILDKLLINASINPISALARLDCGQIADARNGAARTLLRDLVGEVASLAATLDPPLPLSLDAEAIIRIYEGTEGLVPSMLQDVMEGRLTEKAHIVAPLVELGEHLEVPTPKLRLVLQLLDALEFPLTVTAERS